MTDRFISLARRRDTVVIFRPLGDDPVFNALLELLDTDTKDISRYLLICSDIAEGLYSAGETDLSRYILRITLECENLYTHLITTGRKPDGIIQRCLLDELAFIQELSTITPEELAENAGYDGDLPYWTVSEIDISGSYIERLSLASKYGFGKWAQSNMFILRNDEIVPVMNPDPQRLSQLFGYERERSAVVNNTLALLSGKPAQNVLLYGDAGTGKSSTVKAIANEYSSSGLRLIEITKQQLSSIPQIVDEISGNPLKFIVFIDDLTFAAGEDCFGALKATLEGSVSARLSNMAIYATSNRRHLVRESFSDREGDDIHRNDTMQETLSLSARFGMRVNFSRPDKKAYLDIVHELAQENGIALPAEELDLQAERFAISSGSGRSPRTAKQFINSLLSIK